MKSRYLVFLVFLCSVSVALAMGGGGGGGGSKTSRALEGKITDEKGQKIEGVEITLFKVDAADVEQAKNSGEGEKTLSTLTGKNGKYRFVAVRPGFYRVRISISGYQTLEKLMEFKRGSKNANLSVELRQIQQTTEDPSGTHR